MRISLICAVLCLSGCVAQRPAQNDLSPAAPKVLISLAATADQQEEPKKLPAIKQLQQLVQSQPLDGQMLIPLAEADDLRAGPNNESDIGRILAAGGPQIDLAILKRFITAERQGRVPGYVPGRYIVGMALALQPSSAVTQSLIEMANSDKEPAPRRRLCRLILAARGDKSRDWMAAIVSDVKAAPQPDASEIAVTTYINFMECLSCVVGKISTAPGLQDALWQRVLRNEIASGSALDALIALADCNADVRSLVHSQQFKDWLSHQPGDGNPGGFKTHLVRACLGIDTKKEMEKALAQVGVYYVRSDRVPPWLFSLAPLLTDKDVRAAIRQGLLSSDAAVRHGALLLAGGLGPDAREMLPAIQKSLFDENAEFRDLNREIFKYVAGLDATGQWCVETNPQYKQLMQASSAKQ